jgi:hypothetical protein
MSTPSKRPRPTPQEVQHPPRVHVTRGSSQNNADRHHPPPRGSHNVRPFDQDTLEREASNNVVEEVEVDVLVDDDGHDDNNDEPQTAAAAAGDSARQRILKSSETQQPKSRRQDELNDDGHIDFGGGNTDNVDNDNDNDEDDEEENNNDDDEGEGEEEESNDNDEEVDDDNAGDDDHHHVSDNNNNAEDNEGRQQAEDRNSWLNYLAWNLVRMSDHFSKRSSQNKLNAGRMWSRRNMLNAGRLWSPFTEHGVNRKIIFYRKWERWCRQTNWREKAFFGLCRGIYLARNNITNEYKAGFIFDEILHDRLVNIYQGTYAQVEVMFISTNDALPRTHLATLEAYLKFALFLQLTNEGGQWVSCYSSVGEVFEGLYKEPTCLRIMNDVYKYATYRLGDDVPVMVVPGHDPLMFTDWKKHPLYIHFLYKVDLKARRRHIYDTCPFTNGNIDMMDEWAFQDSWRVFARGVTTRCTCIAEKQRERTKLAARMVDIDEFVEVNNSIAEEAESRYNVDSLAAKLKKKGARRNGKFDWQGLGHQVSVCFSALPSNCSFLNGPIDATQSGGPRRLVSPRRIVTDYGETELTSEHMKAMLRDISDIVLEDEPGLADWPREDADEVDPEYARVSRVLNTLPMERLLARPCLGDDGGLAPELLALWGRNTVKISGKPGTQLPFRMRGAKGQEQRCAAAKELMEEEEAEDVEKARSEEE